MTAIFSIFRFSTRARRFRQKLLRKQSRCTASMSRSTGSSGTGTCPTPANVCRIYEALRYVSCWMNMQKRERCSGPDFGHQDPQRDVPAGRDQLACPLCQRLDAQAFQVVRRCVEQAGFASRIAWASAWYPDHRAAPCPREQHAVLIANEHDIRGFPHCLPLCAAELATHPPPAGRRHHEVTAPTNSRPIQFESLALELCRCNLQGHRRPRIVNTRQEPVLVREPLTKPG